MSSSEQQRNHPSMSKRLILSVTIELRGIAEQELNTPIRCERIQNTPQQSSFEEYEPTTARAGAGKDRLEQTRAIRLVVSLPRRRVLDSEFAGLIGGLLYEQLDQLEENSSSTKSEQEQYVVVQGITVSGLRFTLDGVEGVKAFLSMHASTIQHVALNDILGNALSEMRTATSKDEIQAFQSLAQAFETANLVSLDLSYNALLSTNTHDTGSDKDGGVWSNFAMHSNLQRLELNYVTIDDASMVQLETVMRKNNDTALCCHLQELHIILLNSLGQDGMVAANSILQHCQRLTSLRWVYKRGTREAKLPWFGLRTMVSLQQTNTTGVCLQHLVMEGARIKERELGENGLCGAIMDLPQLQTLKLRNLGLIDSAIHRIVTALHRSSCPIVSLDLGFNAIPSRSVEALEELTHERFVHTLKDVCLDHNKLDSVAASYLQQLFGNKGIKIGIEGNGSDTHDEISSKSVRGGTRRNRNNSMAGASLDRSSSHSVYSNSDLTDFPYRNNLMSSSHSVHSRQGSMDRSNSGMGYVSPLQLNADLRKLESERDDLLNENDQKTTEIHQVQEQLQQMSAAQTTILADFRFLQQENAKLKEDREILVRAFHILGLNKQMEEGKVMLERVAKLEHAVFGSSSATSCQNKRNILITNDLRERTGSLSQRHPMSVLTASSTSLDISMLDPSQRSSRTWLTDCSGRSERSADPNTIPQSPVATDMEHHHRLPSSQNSPFPSPLAVQSPSQRDFCRQQRPNVLHRATTVSNPQSSSWSTLGHEAGSVVRARSMSPPPPPIPPTTLQTSSSLTMCNSNKNSRRKRPVRGDSLSTSYHAISDDFVEPAGSSSSSVRSASRRNSSFTTSTRQQHLDEVMEGAREDGP